MESVLINLKDFIIGDRVFQVPIYQRNYSWEKKHLEDLWTDIIYLDASKKHHYGTILMKKTNKTILSGVRNFEIYELIDGQQRLCTILIFLKELFRQLKRLIDNEEQFNDFKKDYFRYNEVYKLDLLGNDKEFFRLNIIEDQNYPEEIITPSQKKLKVAKHFFRKELKDVGGNIDSDSYREFLLEIKKKIENLQIIRYVVDEESDAILIFETINDRGKPLSKLDKTKSFFMHLAYLSDPAESIQSLEEINLRFSNIFRYLETIRSKSRGKSLGEEDIQRYHFVTYDSGDKKKSSKYLDLLKSKLRDFYRSEDRQNCLRFITHYVNDLENAFYTVKEIVSYDENDQIGVWIKKLFRLERLAGFYPLLIAIWTKFNTNQQRLLKILRLIEIYCFRVYAIGGKRSDTGEAGIYKLAFSVHTGNLRFREIVASLEELTAKYAPDDRFKTRFESEDFWWDTSNTDIRYFFYEYETSLREEQNERLTVDYNAFFSEEFQIEHIWAQKPRENDYFSDEEKKDHEESVSKIGNLTLASRDWNLRWGNKPFEEKKGKYRDSVLRIQRKLAVYENWNGDTINERGARMTRFALQRWGL